MRRGIMAWAKMNAALLRLNVGLLAVSTLEFPSGFGRLRGDSQGRDP